MSSILFQEKGSKIARNRNLFVLFIAFSTEKGSKTTVKNNVYRYCKVPQKRNPQFREER